MNSPHKGLLDKLLIDCSKCSGLCCVALYFSKYDGFPQNKDSGKPCMNLQSDYRCTVHSKLREYNLKGCTAYDCFGAGQFVTQNIYKGLDWKTRPDLANQIFEVFLSVFQLHQILWYLVEASMVNRAQTVMRDIDELIAENNYMTRLSPKQILELDIDEYRGRVNVVLKKTAELVSTLCWNCGEMGNDSGRSMNGKSMSDQKDYMGKHFKKANLNGWDFSMSLLIAANLEGCSLCGTNFLGADMRDSNICNADLSESLFLSQQQVNGARGNRNTKLPKYIKVPEAWRID